MELTATQFDELVKNLGNKTEEQQRAVLVAAGVKVTWEKNKWYPKSLFNVNYIPQFHEVLLKNNNASMDEESKYTVGFHDLCGEFTVQDEGVDWTHFMILE